MTIVGVPSYALDDALWGQVEAILQPALDREGGRLTPADIRSAIESREMQLWVAHNDDGSIRSACVTGIAVCAAKVATLHYAAGELQDFGADNLAEVEAWARAQGCTALDVVGRPGWRRALPGFEKLYEVITKRL